MFCLFCRYSFFFFFFQAEDGIRDVAVTGVQTCALPICRRAVTLANHLNPTPCTLPSIRRCSDVTASAPHTQKCSQCRRHGRFRRSAARSEEHTSELQSRLHLVCRLLLEKKKKKKQKEKI